MLRLGCFAVGILLLGQPAFATTYQVGSGRTYTSPCDLVKPVGGVMLQPGDIIEVDAGTYTDYCQLTASGTAQAPIVMRGVPGPRPIFDATGADLSGSGSVPRAIFQWNSASYWQVSHLELEHAANASNNGSGFRLTNGGNVTFSDMSIHDNQDGAQSDGPAVIEIDDSDIYANGANDGQSHNLYLQGDVVRLVGNHIHDSRGGQNIKLRTRYVEIVGNYVENAGNYEVDLIQGPYTSMPNANAVLIGNVFIRATSSDNNSQTILFGTDNPADTTPSRNGALYAIANTFILRNASNQLFHVLTSSPTPAPTHIYLYDNIVYATVAGTHLTSDAMTEGYVTGSNNFIADGIVGGAALTATVGGTSPGFVGSDDYHLAAGSPAIDVGLATPQYLDGAGTMQNGEPMLEPTPPIGSEVRSIVGVAIDLGAFEFGNMPSAGDDTHGVGDDAGTSSGGKAGGCCEVDGGATTSSWLLIGLVALRLVRRRAPDARRARIRQESEPR